MHELRGRDGGTSSLKPSFVVSSPIAGRDDTRWRLARSTSATGGATELSSRNQTRDEGRLLTLKETSGERQRETESQDRAH